MLVDCSWMGSETTTLWAQKPQHGGLRNHDMVGRLRNHDTVDRLRNHDAVGRLRNHDTVGRPAGRGIV